jgi:hypothetical protein
LSQKPPAIVRFASQIGLLLILALLVTSCRQAEYLARAAGRVTSPDHASASRSEIAVAGASVTNEELPPEQVNPGFDFESMGNSDDGKQRYRVRIKGGGSPALVAFTRLTPLFNLDGKDGPTYVSDAFFAQNPHRNPRTIQPGDTFVLELPPDAFVVRWSEVREEGFGGRAKIQEFVSMRGDRLRFYLTDPFPLRHELMDVNRPGIGIVQLSGEIPYLLSTGQTDVFRLAQLVYRVMDPDMFQMEKMKSLVAGLSPGEDVTMEVDRIRSHLDPVREVLPRAKASGQVPDPAWSYLTRYTFEPDGVSPYAAVEDALGTRTNIGELPGGRVFRVEYGWDGTVRVSYRTGQDDARGKRDPLQLRDDDRWAGVYKEAGVLSDPPVKWSAGQPSDLNPFPTARDPRQRTDGGELSYDFLIPGRALVLTFQPIRHESDVRAERELRDSLHELQEQIRGNLEQSRGRDIPSPLEGEG